MKTEAAKTEFKFDCPKCGQHILVSSDWMGLRISCPSCQSRIVIPSAPSGDSRLKPASSSLRIKPTIRIELPPTPAKDTSNLNGQPVGSNAGEAVMPTSVTGKEPWPELVQHLEKGALAEPAVLVTALFHELTHVRQRLDELERKLDHDRSSNNAPPTQPAKTPQDSGEVRR